MHVAHAHYDSVSSEMLPLGGGGGKIGVMRGGGVCMGESRAHFEPYIAHSAPHLTPIYCRWISNLQIGDGIHIGHTLSL